MLLDPEIRAQVESSLADVQIDERVRELVIALNATPGIYTFSSCGGHRGRRAISQVKRGEFYVCFELGWNDEAYTPTSVAWESLRRIAEATLPFSPHVNVVAWDNGGALDFEVKGRHNADPSAFASELVAVVYGDREVE